jgi:general stress protein 26
MDSINKNQPEKNREDLRDAAALQKMREISQQAENCFFCTSALASGPEAARPMNVRQVDEEGNLWFLSASDSHKNEELKRNPSVRLYFQGSKHSDFLLLNGRATITTNRDKIKQLWDPTLRTWFTEGVDDPRITAIKVEPIDGYYWDNKHGDFVAGVKMLLGAALGTTLDDSIEGTLRV